MDVSLKLPGEKLQRDIYLLKMVVSFLVNRSLFLESGSLVLKNGSLFYENGIFFYENWSLFVKNESLFFENGSKANSHFRKLIPIFKK